MSDLTYTPIPVPSGTNASVGGSGFRILQTQLRLDGAIVADTFKPARGGSFRIGVTVKHSTLDTIQLLEAFQRRRGSDPWELQTTEILRIGGDGVVTPVPPGAPAFGARPRSAPIVRRDVASVLIENVHISGGTRDNVTGTGIWLENIPGAIVLRGIDLENLVGGIFTRNCTGTLLIEDWRSRNIGNGVIGSGQSNHIQLAECSLEGTIRRFKLLGGQTEDMFSTWHSGGKGVGHELVIEDGQIQGLVATTPTARAWGSTSGTGIILGDGRGSPRNGYLIVRRLQLLTPGQVGIQCIDGPGLQVYQNTIYGEQRPLNNNPMTSWEGTPRGVVHDNRYYWTNADGSHPDPWFGHGEAFDPPQPNYMVLSDNVEDPSIDPKTLAVVL